MRSLERTLSGWGAALPGAAAIQLLGVAVLLGLQTMEIGGNIQLLQFRGAWALQPLCIAMLAAMAGMGAASVREHVATRTFLIDTLRLVGPTYGVAVVAALLAGSLLSNQSTSDYFTDPETAAYALNLIGWPHYFLPGVFEFNDVAGVVNRTVWIAPFFLIGTAAVSLLHRRWGLQVLPASIALMVALAALAAQALGFEPGGQLEFGTIALKGDGLSATIGGLVAAALVRSRRYVPMAVGWRLACLGLVFALIILGNDDWANSASFRVVSGAVVAYATVVTATYPLPGSHAARRATPYLLGVYLFAFPLQQGLVQLAPFTRQAMINAAVGLAMAAVLSVAFWLLIGRRVLSERQRTPPVFDVVQGSVRRRQPVFRSRSDAAVQIALTGLFFAVALGFMAMLYVAMLPQSEGM